MCGIAGAFFSRSKRTVDRDLVARMCSKIVHRGPDDDGMHFDAELGMGMRRLSIIDLDSGRQPIFNEDGSIGVVFNGEIYNFQELRQDLQSRGHVFATRSDTEVIVHLYEEYGDRFPERLNGMFAIALWDSRLRKLVLVRDRIGVKPLYYSWTRDGLVFGSELKCLLEHDDLDLDLDGQALYHYFTLNYIPHPFSIYRGVRQLPPAGRLSVTGDSLKIDRYWELPRRIDRTQTRSDVIDRLRELLTDAVRIRMVSDVPVGAFLSGGLDSSIVVALMAQQSANRIKTFHIDFDQPEDSEKAFAQAVAQRYDTDHHELEVRPSAADILDDLVHYFDEPFGDSSAVPTYYVSQLTRQHVTVALSGDGGDESFAGYSHYRRVLARARLPRMVRRVLGAAGGGIESMLPRTAPGRRFLRGLGMSDWQIFTVGTQELEARSIFSRDFLASLGEVSTFGMLEPILRAADSSDRLAPHTSADIAHYLPDQVLTKVDRMSMAHSLEVRGPLLDYRIIELAASLPAEWKIANGDWKVILKEAFARDLPDSVLKARKRGFSIPRERWLREDLRHVLDDAINDADIASCGIFNMRAVRGLYVEHMKGVRNRAAQLWRFLFFVRWWRRHMAERHMPQAAALSGVPS